MKKLYLGRRGRNNQYELGRDSTSWDSLEGFKNVPVSELSVMSDDEFHDFSNIHLRPGQLVEVEAIMFKVKPVKGR